MDSVHFDKRAEQSITNSDTPNKTDTVSLKKKSFPFNMPSFEEILKNETAIPNPSVQKPVMQHKPSADGEFVRKIVEKISDSQQRFRSAEIPSFDLGRQILAGQRKAAALKRKSPQSLNDLPKTSRLIQSIAAKKDFAFTAPASPQQRIIADIVAKEILILSSAR